MDREQPPRDFVEMMIIHHYVVVLITVVIVILFDKIRKLF